MMVRGAPTGADVARSRLGVVDIGSNSIRLVVYDGLTRAPLPIVNRKAVIGLGTDVERLGRIGAEAFAVAVETITALVRLAEDIPVARLALLATAAVREAANGEAFCEAVAAACGRRMTILTGDDEARISAIGVISAAPSANGIVGDLGGGSLELVAVENGRVLQQTSLPIGPLRLMERNAGRLDDASMGIDLALASAAWLEHFRGREFYAVGGAWRAIARLYMAQHNYPLHVIHGFRLQPREARDFTAMLEHLGRQTTSQIRAVSRKRAEVLPWGAVVLERIVSAMAPAGITFSAHGLREGFHFGELDETTRLQDPLIAACRDLADQSRRFPDATEAIEAWLAPVSSALDGLSPRLLRAVVTLADIGWREHPEYRAEHAMLRVLRMPWSVLSHSERGYLGLALYLRYGGSTGDAAVETCRRLLREDDIRHAKALGKALRLAFELSSGRAGALASMPLTSELGGLTLAVPMVATVTLADKVERYAASLGRAIDRSIRIVATTAPQRKKAAG